ncbi:MAG: DUF523 domain-containing protein [Candidatus Aenigmatarchaeota archaeon]
MKVVSACLAGVKCRWDGTAAPCQKVIELVRQGKAIPVCPEQLAGLPTPRPPRERSGSRVITKDGKDVTEELARGAKEALRIAKMAGCKEAILKSRSPACGSGEIYDGTFSGKLTKGDGVFTELLKKKTG